MFTTQHYRAIANVLAAHVPTDDLRDGDVCLRRVGDALAQMFANDNDRFKRALFLAAAGFAPDEDASELDFGARYAVDGQPGVAFWLKSYLMVQPECAGHPAADEPNDGHAGIGEVVYCDGSCEQPIEDEARVIAVMVGDDREHIIDVDDLTKLDDDAACRVCGQIGCTHDGRSE